MKNLNQCCGCMRLYWSIRTNQNRLSRTFSSAINQNPLFAKSTSNQNAGRFSNGAVFSLAIKYSYSSAHPNILHRIMLPNQSSLFGVRYCSSTNQIYSKILSANQYRPFSRFLTTVTNQNAANLRRSRIKRSIPLKSENSKACNAYCTGESYNIDLLREYFVKDSTNYTLGVLPQDATDSLYIKKKDGYQGDADIFFFRRLGAFVCWNMTEEEISNLRLLIETYEFQPYDPIAVEEEHEQMTYIHTENPTSLIDGDIYLHEGNTVEREVIEKYAFSNAMALSVKLDMWETSLEEFSTSMRYVPETLKRGFKVTMSRNDVLKKIGELLTLRHQITLYSDLLTTPDFYWDRDELEKLYTKTCTYLEITKRTKVMNEKLNLCSEMVEMLRSHLNERHGHRLEWMIIVLITIEILFEIIRLVEKYV